ncbi:HLA class II histocompatibility antigen, DO alpha chain isoform X2 [Marmota marmota marmota]|uniref:HLA class II histocompatibility antigen, DO alpha chain isoform X2 n=1 Tax=Marmota marmota marmota TaxID=9994 RepID=UPI00076278E2|nr:HLA class II histocompatibility antigen, DO alpha chain isoform X2 [Marmota marmota marmota]XP_027799462.1 HLA class II histocompatibility antigen, DO alpha chain-like isoform X2 [Marmota flaviventris]
MALRAGLVLGLHTLMTLLCPHKSGAIKADHMGSYGPAFFQSYGASGQFTHEFDGDQLFSVDLKNGEVAWRLPEFGDFTHFDPQNGLASIAIIRAHLDILVERSNRTRATSVPPRVTVLPKSRVELGEPNILICIVDNIFPPVINVTWLRNDDFYDCKVEHWGLQEPLLTHWEPQVPVPPPDTTETLICAMGLAIGLMGFLMGTILIITGTCMSSAPR